jgi:hypothetical protein
VPAQMTVDIPTEWLATEPTLPDRCARHGLPAVQRKTFAVRSNPKIGSRKKVFQPGYTSLNRAEEYARQVKIAKVSGWPLCARCVRRRVFGLTAAAVLFFGGLATMVAAFIIAGAEDGPNAGMLAPILGGFAAMLLSPLALRWGSIPRLTGTELTSDGAIVKVADASSEFLAGLPSRT